MFRGIFYLINLFAITSCIQPFNVELPKPNEQIVIEGLLTNEEGGHYVKVSYLRSIGSDSVPYAEGASVVVEDGQGNQTAYSEISPGIHDSPPDFCGTPGESYQLRVQLGRETYLSDWTIMPEPEPIDSIYIQFNETVDDVINEIVGGAQFFLDSYLGSNEILFFRCNWESVYRVLTPCGNISFVCYGHKTSSQIILFSTSEQTSNDIIQLPIHFVKNGRLALNDKYSMTVNQYRINKETYDYYRKLNKNVESTGTLFDSQKGLVLGNIKKVVDRELEPILGFFEVSGVSTQRRYFYPVLEDSRILRQDICNGCPCRAAGNPYLAFCCDCNRIIPYFPKPDWWED